MVLLHLHCKNTGTASNRVRLQIPITTPKQQIVYKKSVVHYNVPASSFDTHTILYARVKGGGTDTFSQEELLNTTGVGAVLPIEFDPEARRTEADYHIRFNASHIGKDIDIEFFKDDGITAQDLHASTDKTIRSVDLYFEIYDISKTLEHK